MGKAESATLSALGCDPVLPDDPMSPSTLLSTVSGNSSQVPGTSDPLNERKHVVSGFSKLMCARCAAHNMKFCWGARL